MGSGLTVDPALGSGQFADMREVATRDWTHLRRQERDHGQRLTGEGHKLHLIAFVLTVDVHNCSDIATHQVFRWQILGQDDAIVFFDHQAATGSCFRTRSSSRLSSLRAKVCPLGSRNSTSKTSGATTSTTVPTCPTVKPSAGLFTNSATTSKSLTDDIRLFISHRVDETRKVFVRPDVPEAAQLGSTLRVG